MIFRYCVLLSLLVAAVQAQEPEVLVELARPRIFQGESVRYAVTLNRCDDAAQPTLPAVDGVTFRQVGRTTFRQTMFDGFRTVSIGGPKIEYVLTPSRTGSITIPGPTIVVDGKTYRGREVTLQVIPPSEQDLAILEVSASRAAVYPLQPFTLRLTVALKALPEPYSDQDPLRGTGELPELVIPWADDESLPESVTAESPAQRWLQAMLTSSRQRAGFGINNVGMSANDLFSLFAERQRAVFRPEPRRLKRKDGQGRTVDYWEYTFERTFVASRIGTLTFNPVSLKGTFAARASTSGGMDMENVYAITAPVTVEVRDVPSDGRPASYLGAVGQFQVDASLTPTTAKVGDPMTLSLRIHGSGSLQDATAPDLQQVPAIAEFFKVYEATEESADGERRFTYALRPKTAGITAFPPVEVAYFDADREQYVTLRTTPIKIEVTESDRLDNQDIAMAATAATNSIAAAESNSEGIFANVTDLRQVHDERVRPGAWLLSLGLMAGLFVVCAVVNRQVQRRRDNPRYQSRRLAAKKAAESLSEVRQLATTTVQKQTCEALSSVVLTFVADVTDRDSTGLTSRDAADALAGIGVAPELASRAQRLLEELDAARYGAAEKRLEQLLDAADQLLDGLVRELRQRKIIA